MQSSTSIKGARIGKYRLVRHIATGGMGTVYKAYDEENDRTVALKVLSPDLAENPIVLERFKREARTAAKLEHKNIVALYDADSVDNIHFLTMEYIEGVDLAEYIRRKGKITHEEARRILIQACKALEHAFAQGITHRDIKPSNFLLANDEGRCRVKLTDLGLARMANEEEFRVTRAGTTVGTVDYMSPEQARDSSLADVRSDIYSLGCTFYHMLAGKPPFAEGGIGERVYKHIATDPTDIRQFAPDVPATLWTVLRRMLAKHPDDRFQTPTELIDALRSLTDPVTPKIREALEESRIENPIPQAPPSEEPTDSGVISPVALPARSPSNAAKARKPSSKPDSSPGDSSPTQRQKKKRDSTFAEMGTMADDPPDQLGVTPEQRNAASGQFTHATEVFRNGGALDYAIQLLQSCCRLDPANVMYRKMLREVVRDQAKTKKTSWFGALTNLPAKSRLKAAARAGEHRKVLEDGEDLLTRLPGDVTTQLEMVNSAKELGLSGVALWMLEEARVGAPEDKSVLEALGEIYQELKRYKQAIVVWEKLRELDPSDSVPGAKIREISVQETLSRGNYGR